MKIWSRWEVTSWESLVTSSLGTRAQGTHGRSGWSPSSQNHTNPPWLRPLLASQSKQACVRCSGQTGLIHGGPHPAASAATTSQIEPHTFRAPGRVRPGRVRPGRVIMFYLMVVNGSLDQWPLELTRMFFLLQPSRPVQPSPLQVPPVLCPNSGAVVVGLHQVHQLIS